MDLRTIVLLISGIFIGNLICVQSSVIVDALIEEEGVKCYQCEGTNCDISDYCENYIDSCVIVILENGAIKKGCRTSLSVSEVEYCTASPEKCSFCPENECNRGVTVFQNVVPKCYSCEGSNCRSTIGAGEEKDCAQVEDCFTLFEEFLPIKRGCYSDLSAAEKAICDDSANNLCSVCSGDHCNDLGRADHKCLVCTSLSVPNCLKNPSDSTMTTTQCPAPLLETDEGQCYSKMAGDVIERGCLTTESDVAACRSGNCKSCNGEDCNKDIFPADRSKCACVGTDCTEPTDYCDYYRDVCVTILQADDTYKKACEKTLTTTDVDYCLTNPDKCAYCSKFECNVGDVNLETTKSCYSCEGSGCRNAAEAGRQKKCYSSDDECVTIFDGFLPIKRGCYFELSDAENIACDNVEDLSCSKCVEDDCNNLGREDHKCAYCTSLSDQNCLKNPSLLTTIQCPAPLLETDEGQCYSKMTGDVIERGCLTTESDVSACTNGNCKSCNGGDCNKDIFPVGRSKCAICEGLTCAATDYCDYYRDVCVTIQQDDGTYKKTCERALLSNEQLFCSNNPQKCAYCSQEECNKGPVGFGTIRTCYSCVGSDCRRAIGEGKQEICHSSDDQCFTIFDGFQPIKRGCYGTLQDNEINICDDPNDMSCSKCSKTNCNDLGREDHKCIYCTSIVDRNCLLNPTALPTRNSVQCPAPSLETTEGQCYTRVIGSVTERGCVTTEIEVNSCETGKCEICTLQNGQPCNNQIFPANRRKCLTCSGTNCANAVETSSYCNYYDDNCITIFRYNQYRKTCAKELTATEQAFCTASSNKCRSCSTTDCNTGLFDPNMVYCKVCDSETNINCLNNPSAAPETVCQSCAIHVERTVNGKLVTKRGCFESLTQVQQTNCGTNTNDFICSKCTDNVCNVGPFPAARLSCMVCNNPPCASQLGMSSQVCPYYSKTDQCFYQIDSTNTVTRLDCRSSLTAAEITTCDSNTNLCKSCSGNNCNNPSLIKLSSCIQCDARTNTLCAKNPAQLDSMPCNDPRDYQCFTRIEGGYVKRGCYGELSTLLQYHCLNKLDCEICSTKNGCNTNIYPQTQIKCFECDSKLDASCKATQTGTPSVCTQYDKNNMCYTIVQNNGDTVRKCSPKAMSLECGGAERCKLCSTDGCNKEMVTVLPTPPTTQTPPTTPQTPQTPPTPSTSSPETTTAAGGGGTEAEGSDATLILVIVVFVFVVIIAVMLIFIVMKNVINKP